METIPTTDEYVIPISRVEDALAAVKQRLTDMNYMWPGGQEVTVELYHWLTEYDRLVVIWPVYSDILPINFAVSSTGELCIKQPGRTRRLLRDVPNKWCQANVCNIHPLTSEQRLALIAAIDRIAA